jgi:hypothetical protein
MQPVELRMQPSETCYKCGGLRYAEIIGDDSCRYFKFVCKLCNVVWTRLAPSVTKGK